MKTLLDWIAVLLLKRGGAIARWLSTLIVGALATRGLVSGDGQEQAIAGIAAIVSGLIEWAVFEFRTRHTRAAQLAVGAKPDGVPGPKFAATTEELADKAEYLHPRYRKGAPNH